MSTMKFCLYYKYHQKGQNKNVFVEKPRGQSRAKEKRLTENMIKKKQLTTPFSVFSHPPRHCLDIRFQPLFKLTAN